MCNFPDDIQYNPNEEKLTNQNIPQGTYTFMKKNRIVNGHILDNIEDMDHLEKEINSRIKKQIDGKVDSLYDIFCLIQIWGGFRGINVFRSKKPFQDEWDNKIKKSYSDLVNTCLSIHADKNDPRNISDCEINKVFDAISTARVISGIDVAFLTKHTRFWLQRNNFNNPLPIFDSVVAGGLMNSAADIGLLKHYWKCMIKKAMSIPGMSLRALERQVFNYYSKKATDDNPIPQYHGRDLVLYGERIKISGESILLFVFHALGSGYGCELWYEPNDVIIYSFDDVKQIIDKFSNDYWRPKKRDKAYLYVKYGEKEGDLERAKELKDKIAAFVLELKKNDFVK